MPASHTIISMQVSAAQRLHRARLGLSVIALALALGLPLWAEDQGTTSTRLSTLLADDDDNPQAKGVDRSADRGGGDDDDQKNGDDDENKLPRYTEELFFGTIIYPQEKGETQVAFGAFRGSDAKRDWELPLGFEYGLTDKLQLQLELPIDLLHDEPSASGLQHAELGLYWNFYNNRQTGEALGVGFNLGVPVSGDAESRSVLYEPFFVAYHDFDTFAVNFSADLKIEDYLASNQPTDVSSELALSLMKRIGKFTPLLELDAEIDKDRTPLRLAPGLVWKPWGEGKQIGVSLPIGLNRDTPDLGVYVLGVIEFSGSKNATDSTANAKK